MNPSIEQRIRRLKEDRNAVILAHNYQIDEVQELADYVGDSLGLSRRAAETDADVIVFCGVYFMAETAALLNPDKTVVIPDPEAGCPMAAMTTAERVETLRRENPDAAVVCYVNSTARVKAVSNICCTSSNAVDVANSFDPDRPIIFTPDRYLGGYVARQTGRELILDTGYCPTHVRILPEHIRELKKRYPEAEVMVHPECRPETTALADVVESTGGMVRHARRSRAPVLIVGTEVGLLYRLRQENPGKEFLPVTPAAVCQNMKRITRQKVIRALEEMKHRVEVAPDVAGPARRAIEAMLNLRTDAAPAHSHS